MEVWLTLAGIAALVAIGWAWVKGPVVGMLIVVAMLQTATLGWLLFDALVLRPGAH